MVSIYFKKNKCLYLLFFFTKIRSAMCFWKIWGDNNCTYLDPVLLCRGCLFSATPAMLRSVFLHRPRYPANVQTSGDFLGRQIKCLLYPSPSDLLSLRQLCWQTMGHLERLTWEALMIRPLVFCKDVTSASRKQFSTLIGRKKKGTIACILKLSHSCFNCRNLLGLCTTFSIFKYILQLPELSLKAILN